MWSTMGRRPWGGGGFVAVNVPLTTGDMMIGFMTELLVSCCDITVGCSMCYED